MLDRANHLGEEIISIADDAVNKINELDDPRLASAFAQIVKHRIAARQWYASKVNAKQWGDKSQLRVEAAVRIMAPDEVNKKPGAGLSKEEGEKARDKQKAARKASDAQLKAGIAPQGSRAEELSLNEEG
jgi:hypothetical protein